MVKTGFGSSTLVSTTNGVEGEHERLKYSYLVHVSGGSLTDLVTVVIKQVLVCTVASCESE